MAPSLNIHKGRGRRRICGGPLACAPHRFGKKELTGFKKPVSSFL